MNDVPDTLYVLFPLHNDRAVVGWITHIASVSDDGRRRGVFLDVTKTYSCWFDEHDDAVEPWSAVNHYARFDGIRDFIERVSMQRHNNNEIEEEDW